MQSNDKAKEGDLCRIEIALISVENELGCFQPFNNDSDMLRVRGSPGGVEQNDDAEMLYDKTKKVYVESLGFDLCRAYLPKARAKKKRNYTTFGVGDCTAGLAKSQTS